MKRWLLSWLVLFTANGLAAQHRLQVLPHTPADAAPVQRLAIPSSVENPAAGWQTVQQQVAALHQQGFLEAYITDYQRSDSSSWYRLSVGPPYQWVRLQATGVPAKVWRQTGYRPRDFIGKTFAYPQLARFMHRLVSHSENHGYPFAQARLDSVLIQNEQVIAKLVLEPGPAITFDSVILEGNARITQKFLQAYLGIDYGAPYTQARINQAARRLRQLPYLNLTAPPRLSFENNRARLYVPAARSAANQFEGLLALQSRPEGGTLLTGQVDLLLQNPFGGGKTLAVNWQRLNTSTQQLQLQYRHPFVLGSPLSLQGSFSLYKEEEAFLNRNFEAIAEVQQASGAVFQVLAQQRDTRLLEEGEQPQLASFRINQYGLGFRLSTVNQVVFPTGGVLVAANLLAGPKRLRSLPRSVTDTSILQNSVLHATANLNLHYYRRLSRRTVVALKAQAGALADDYQFLPDLYRLGGLYSLRGFREQSVPVSQYGLLQTELRQRIGQASYLFLFYDQAWVRQQIYQNPVFGGWPAGLGAGLNLATNAGVFSLVYALGKPAGQALSGQNSQVHFGYISRF